MAYNEGNKTFEVGASDIGDYLLVKLSSGKLVVSGASDTPLGATDYPVKAGENCAPRLLNRGGTIQMTASAAISQGAEVEPAASGKIATKSTGTAIGIALEAASTDGDVIEVLPY